MTDTVFRVEVTAAEAEHRAHLRRAVVASTVGTAIEWYDFLIYSTMTGLVFGKVFFLDPGCAQRGRRVGNSGQPQSAKSQTSPLRARRPLSRASRLIVSFRVEYRMRPSC